VGEGSRSSDLEGLPLSRQDRSRYLQRIGFEGAVRHDVATLERLQRAHLTAVPFENLDVFARRGVVVDPERSFTKVVVEGRGGWCYELNGAFHALLVALGFDADLLGATVVMDDAEGPQPDHATVRVTLDRPYLVDVGFGDSFVRPLALDTHNAQDGGDRRYRFAEESGHLFLQSVKGEVVQDRYRFTLEPVTPRVFEPANQHLQALERWFEAPFATRLVEGGPNRVTLLHDRIKFRREGRWSQEPIRPSEFADHLARWFGMEM
jgi:N-hydroxyarylamine O-acetyltransferase